MKNKFYDADTLIAILSTLASSSLTSENVQQSGDKLESLKP